MGGSVRRLTGDQVAEIRVGLACGSGTIASWARRLGFSETAVRRAARGTRSHKGSSSAPAIEARPSTGRPPRISAATVAEVRRGRAAGESVREVAARCGISRRHAHEIGAGRARLDVEG